MYVQFKTIKRHQHTYQSTGNQYYSTYWVFLPDSTLSLQPLEESTGLYFVLIVLLLFLTVVLYSYLQTIHVVLPNFRNLYNWNHPHVFLLFFVNLTFTLWFLDIYTMFNCGYATIILFILLLMNIWDVSRIFAGRTVLGECALIMFPGVWVLELLQDVHQGV